MCRRPASDAGSLGRVCACVRVCVCVHACVRACVRFGAAMLWPEMLWSTMLWLALNTEYPRIAALVSSSSGSLMGSNARAYTRDSEEAQVWCGHAMA